MLYEHTNSGNCWKFSKKCKECGEEVLCDVCHEHSLPRGDCDECPRCLLCDDPELENS